MIIQSIDIPNALRLDSQIVDSLIKGDIIAAIPRTFTNAGRTFALYPDQLEIETVTVSAWARCEQCDIVDDSKPLDIISHYTAIPVHRLQEIIAERESFFLIYLRVYRLSKPVTIPARSQGQYVALPDRLKVDDSSPILSDQDFARIKQQIKNLEPPESLDIQLQRILNEVENKHKVELSRNTSWIKTISTLGDRSIEQDQGKSTYQAGTDFENIAKQGLEFLGFTIDESHKGGAGGLDLFCLKPYPLTGECKAGKSIPSGTTEELLKLGGMRLGRDRFLESKKLIIGAGKVSNDVITASHEWKVSIIKAMTLQKLVELKAKYDGAINLFELKEYLQAGQIDNKIDEYIQKVEDEIKLRAYVVQTVKNFLLNNSFKDVETNVIFGLYAGSNPPKNLSTEELKEILIELSSPLAGYLGRVKGNGEKGDRFYYLRDLPCDTQN
ncbi:MAG: DUF1802 family protein [Pseudanabaenaceae cyanobacterium bins.39]|nr:DUF1802 family protein [Pseudanabaenaceae cyanobacterium bins.39]